MNGVKVVGWGPGCGYGDATRAYVLGLHRRGVAVIRAPLVRAAEPPGWRAEARRLGDPELDGLADPTVPYDTVLLHTTPELWPSLAGNERGKRVVGMTVWETDALPRHWPPLLDSVDAIAVPCRWNAAMFGRGARVVPHIVDGEATSGRAPWPGIEDGTFVFYTIATWTERKAVIEVVEAYLRAFTADDPVVLVVKTDRRNATALPGWPRGRLERLEGKLTWWLRGARPRPRDVIARRLRREARPPRVVVVDDRLDRAAIRRLHQRGDCFVSLCRSEGWGLGAFDAAAHGNAVVMTGYGGQLDFLHPAHAWLVDYDLEPARIVEHRGAWRSQRWARARIPHAVACLREVFADPDVARRRGAALRDRVTAEFCEDAVIDTLMSVLEPGTRPDRAAG